MNDTIAEIRRQEGARIRALLDANWPALTALVTEDLVHIHATGQIEDKVHYLDSVQTKLEFLKVERVSLHVRAYEDFAVATGELLQTLRVKESGTVFEVRAVTTQTWIRQDNVWVQSSFQATRIAGA